MRNRTLCLHHFRSLLTLLLFSSCASRGLNIPTSAIEGAGLKFVAPRESVEKFVTYLGQSRELGSMSFLTVHRIKSSNYIPCGTSIGTQILKCFYRRSQVLAEPKTLDEAIAPERGAFVSVYALELEGKLMTVSVTIHMYSPSASAENERLLSVAREIVEKNLADAKIVKPTPVR